MSNSSLVQVKVPTDSSNYTRGRQKKIRCVTVHHMAGVMSAEACGNIFARAGRNGSSHYGIGNDGKIGQYVNEEDTAWTNSNWNANSESVTIEVSNSATGGLWPVSDASFDSLVKLVADIAKRNELGDLVAGQNLTWHRMFTATTCPGEYLLNRMNEIADKANKINHGEEQDQEAGKPNNSDDGQRMTNEQVAHEIMYGHNKWGDMPERKVNLEADGYDFKAIQDIINATLLPNQDKRPEPVPTDIKEGDQVVPVKLVDENGTPLVQYDPIYTVLQYDKENGRVVLGARGGVWAAMNVNNVRKA